MNGTPSGERTHIAFFGRRNAGKSSLVNALTGQSLSVVSPEAGTTTDPVYKAMELLPLGPVMIIDTPGFDDEGSLGELRVKKTLEILGRTDLAVLVLDGERGFEKPERELAALLRSRNVPVVTVCNKKDRVSGQKPGRPGDKILFTNALTGEGAGELKELIAKTAGAEGIAERAGKQPLAADLVPQGGTAVLVVPIDESAPKGRLILPQQQVIRDLLEAGAVPVICRETELAPAMEQLKQPPDIVITDSQAFRKVSEIVPEEIPLTSFSILMARYKGFLDTALEGIRAVDSLKEGDRVLIAEGCTHHRQCNDIGTVKIPRWLREHTGAEIRFDTASGREFPEDLTPYRAVIHCGGCMLNEREIMTRMDRTVRQGVPFINYGILIAHMNRILERSVKALSAPLPGVL